MGTILALDQGTTSSRAILFEGTEGGGLRPVRTAQAEFAQHYPASGWVEHEAADILRTQLDTMKEAAAGASPAAIGITNQRETTVVWDRSTGEAIHNAIVWQDRRTAERCAALKADGLEPEVTAKTGLLLDPYFSATKAAWILDEMEGARARAEAGELAFGTVDSFLIWHLTEGRVHATDATNASRTMLYDIHEGRWDPGLCEALGVPEAMLPEVRDCAGDFGETTLLGGGAVPIRGVAGDQQAAALGQACFEPGMLKATYGTGLFALLHTGKAVASENRLLTTVAWQLGGERRFALEGSIFVAGAVVQWLRDGIGLVEHAGDTAAMAEAADEGVTLVPAFTGMGAPYWDADCRGAMFGLTRGTGRDEIARAALESVGFQTRDLIEAMATDAGGLRDTVLRADGGMSASDWTMQFVADMCGAPVDRPTVLETTALGAAWLAGMDAGVCGGMEAFAASWALDRRFEPAMGDQDRARGYARWRDAVSRTLTR